MRENHFEFIQNQLPSLLPGGTEALEVLRRSADVELASCVALTGQTPYIGGTIDAAFIHFFFYVHRKHSRMKKETGITNGERVSASLALRLRLRRRVCWNCEMGIDCRGGGGAVISFGVSIRQLA